MWMKASLLENCIKTSKKLEPMFMFYSLANPGDIDEKNALERHTALMKMLNEAILRDREERNRTQLKRANQQSLEELMKPGKAKEAAPVVPDTGAPAKGKGKDKGKSKDSKGGKSTQKGPGPSPSGKGKGDKGSGGKASGSVRTLCFEYVFGNCTNPNCPYPHEMPRDDAERAALKKKMEKMKSRSPSPASPRKKWKGKGKGKDKNPALPAKSSGSESDHSKKTKPKSLRARRPRRSEGRHPRPRSRGLHRHHRLLGTEEG